MSAVSWFGVYSSSGETMMRTVIMALVALTSACGAESSDLVVLELPLARNTALAEIGQLKIELYAPSTDCNTLVRKSEDDPIDPVATQVWDLTPDERRAGADRYWDNLQPSPEGSTWNILIQAYGEEELRVGYACHSKELLAGQSIVISYVAREHRREPGT